MKEVEKILSRIEKSIIDSVYLPVETEKIELKPTPPNLKEAASLIQTVCAFLNTNGGIIIVGVKDVNNVPEKDKHYEVVGYQEHFEPIIKEIAKKFTDKDGSPVDVSSHIVGHEILDFLNDRVCAIYVERLPDDQKFVYYNSVAYKREITGDHRISQKEIQSHAEFKDEIRNASELNYVHGAKISNLDVDKLNAYIHLLNREVKTETIKVDLEDAKSFLNRKRFVIDGNVTILGLLVCGQNIKDFLGWRCQVDGFVNTPFDVAQDKKSLIDNVIQLMEKSLGYVLKNIQIGVSSEGGGISKPEYPQQLLRETINNALAHRDYVKDKYININIKPNDYIEIRNPGAFKKSLLIESLNSDIIIRRIIPDSKPRNPKLADILKIFDKWEGKSRGMSNLVADALAGKVDLPYYKFHSENELSLFIKKGKLLDEKMESLFTTYNGYIERKLNGLEITQEQKLVLTYFYKSEIENRNDRYTILLTRDNNHLDAINLLEDNGLIIKHESSNELFSVYVVDRNLFKKTFISELRLIFGADYDGLRPEAREILECVYEFNHFSKTRFPSANMIGNTLWAKSGKANQLEGYDDFKRRVRYFVSQMEKRKVLKRVGTKAAYSINTNFVRRPSIYDE
jgi:ATP-dependent DNA helicase RecG